MVLGATQGRCTSSQSESVKWVHGGARADPPTASCAAGCVRGRHTSSPCEKLSVPVRDTSFQSEREREREQAAIC